jgi:hypothetical protein
MRRANAIGRMGEPKMKDAGKRWRFAVVKAVMFVPFFIVPTLTMLVVGIGYFVRYLVSNGFAEIQYLSITVPNTLM